MTVLSYRQAHNPDDLLNTYTVYDGAHLLGFVTHLDALHWRAVTSGYWLKERFATRRLAAEALQRYQGADVTV